MNLCFQTVVLEKTLENPLDCTEVKSINPKGNQSWIFIGRTDAEAAIFWPPDVNSGLIGKDLDAGKDWGKEEKRVTGSDDWMAVSTQWTSLSKPREIVKGRKPWRATVHRVTSMGHDWATEQQENVFQVRSCCSMCQNKFFLWSNNILLYGYITFCSSVLMDSSAVFTFGSHEYAAVDTAYRCCWSPRFQFVWGLYLKMECFANLWFRLYIMIN